MLRSAGPKVMWAGRARTFAFWLLTVLVATSIVVVLLPTGPAPAAATFVVDRNDDPDPTTATACTAAANDCSMRGAVVAANAVAGADAITVPAGTYTLTREGEDEEAASTGDLDVTDDLTITGAGVRTTSVAGATSGPGGPALFDDRIFHNQPAATTTITGLTITGGNLTASTTTSAQGGGVQNNADLTLERVVVKGNIATRDGGIFSDGDTLNLTDSTVSGNSANIDFAGIRQEGGTANITDTTINGNQAGQDVGGVIVTASGTLNITNTTISGNQAARFNGGVISAGLVNIVNSTIASNTSSRLGGGILTAGVGSLVVVKNTIVTGNTLDNCDTAQLGGVISSQGNNISSDDSCPFTKPTDNQNTNPRLGPLASNGGPTLTRALLAGSPAVDAAANAACPPRDQRGVLRPQRGVCDIGAYELRNSPPVARDNAYNAREDTTLTKAAPGVLGNDTDADGDALRAVRVSGPTKGTLRLRPNGAFTYEPKANFNGTVRFVYRASDGHGGSDTATVTLRIEARPG